MKNSLVHFAKFFFFPIALIFSLIAGCASESPDVARGDVLVWTNEALATTLNYSYANYPQQFQTASKYFTPKAWSRYKEALRISKTLDRVERQELVASAVVQGTPTIVSENIVNGHYTWQVQVPMLLIYENPRTRITQSAVVSASVVRVGAESGIGVRGLAINQLLVQAAPAKEEAKEERVIRKSS